MDERDILSVVPRDARELDGAWTRSQRHASDAPAPDLAPFVARLWSVEWDYPEPYRQKIVPYPQVHLTVRPGAGDVEVHGVAERHVVRELSGTGRVVGAAFRPGAFRAFVAGPVRSLTGRIVPARDLPCFAGAPEDPADPDGMQQWLRAVLPCPDLSAAAREAAALVERVAADRSLTRVDELAAVAGLGVRALQRLFGEHVGVGPKWVIRRYRLHEVTEAMAAGRPVRWAELAADLGYADQSHLTREFTALFGEPPGWYARRYPTSAPGQLADAVRRTAAGETVLGPTVAATLTRTVRGPSRPALTPREVEVLGRVGRGLSNSEVARELTIGASTVKSHLLRVFEKLGVDDRTAAVTTAIARGILPPPDAGQ